MAKSVTLLSTNPRPRKNPSRTKRNPAISIPVVGRADYGSIKTIAGGLGGGVVATMMPKFANMLVSRFSKSGGGMFQQILLVGVAWTANALIGGVIKKQQPEVGNAYLVGASAVHAMQLLNVFSGGKLGLAPAIAGPSGGRSVGQLPAPSAAPMRPLDMPQPQAMPMSSAVSGARPSRISGTVDVPSGAVPGGRRHINIT